MPEDAALRRAVDGHAAGWGYTEELLAVAVELLAQGNWLFVEANKARGAHNPKPTPVRRPYDEAEPAAARPGLASTTELRRFFGAGR